MQMGGFSRAGLIQPLSSKAGDQLTVAQATYAASHVGLWQRQRLVIAPHVSAHAR
jgi:hypothetical protein